jgi:hypothetical protein
MIVLPCYSIRLLLLLFHESLDILEHLFLHHPPNLFLGFVLLFVHSCPNIMWRHYSYFIPDRTSHEFQLIERFRGLSPIGPIPHHR